MEFLKFFIPSTLVSFVLINLYFLLAKKYLIIDTPNHRSSHSMITIRGGGIIIPIIILMYAFYTIEMTWYFCIGLTLVSVVSFIDDIKNILPLPRAVAHMISAFLLLLSISAEFNLYYIPLAFFVVFFFNGYNFMDGINGITGIYSSLISLSIYTTSEYLGISYDKNLVIIFLGGVVVFLFYNLRKKAKCFAGDVGSISIAFVNTYLLLRLINETKNAIFILFVTVYLVDVIYTIIERLWLKQNIFHAHRMHLYQKLANEMNYSHRFVSISYTIVQLIINVVVVLMYRTEMLYQILFSFFILVICSIVYLNSKYRQKIISINKFW